MDRPNTHEMVIVHRMFRRELRLASQLVRETQDGDQSRARTLAAHIDEYLGLLHHHHETEDEFLWPRLHARARTDSEVIRRMEDQHAGMADLIDTAADLLPGWRAEPTGSATAKMAGVLWDLSDLLDDHLDDEEANVLPLAAQHISVAEWNELAQQGLGGVPKQRLLIILGAVFEDADPQERALLKAKLPLIARVLWQLGGARRYRREVSRIRGLKV